MAASRRVFLRLVALGGGAAVASACSASPPSAAAPSTQLSPVAPVSAPATAAKSTADLRIALASEPNTFDPHLTVGRNTQIFLANIYDGLTARDPRANLVPALATGWHGCAHDARAGRGDPAGPGVRRCRSRCPLRRVARVGGRVSSHYQRRSGAGIGQHGRNRPQLLPEPAAASGTRDPAGYLSGDVLPERN